MCVAVDQVSYVNKTVGSECPISRSWQEIIDSLDLTISALTNRSSALVTVCTNSLS
jgi:hypothetical protein